MEKRKVAIDLVKANYFALALTLGAMIVFGVPFLAIWGKTLSHSLVEVVVGNNKLNWIWALGAVVLGIIGHELIHGLTWAVFAPSHWRSISFGVMWKTLTPYCHCDAPLRRRAYLWGALMPCVVVGIIPAVVSLCNGSLAWLAWGVFFIGAAAGDIWMSWLLLKERPGCMVLDHPSEAAFYILDD